MQMSDENIDAEEGTLKPGVSAVVCCYNSAQVIVPTILALHQQIIPPELGYEVILVDNACTDNTVELAKVVWHNSTLPLRIVEESQPGLMNARKAGVLKARYDILLFVDDDNIIESDWIRKISYLFARNRNVGIIGGYNRELIDGEKPSWFDMFKSMYACGTRIPINESGVITGKTGAKYFGAGLAFRTLILREIINGYPPVFLTGRKKNVSIRGDDTELVLRALLSGWDFYYENTLTLQHHILNKRLKWRYLCRCAKGSGATMIVLQIYRSVLCGEKPVLYKDLLKAALQELVELIKNPRTILQIRKTGDPMSIKYYRLFGKLAGLKNFRNNYSEISRQIYARYRR